MYPKYHKSAIYLFLSTEGDRSRSLESKILPHGDKGVFSLLLDNAILNTLLCGPAKPESIIALGIARVAPDGK